MENFGDILCIAKRLTYVADPSGPGEGEYDPEREINEVKTNLRDLEKIKKLVEAEIPIQQGILEQLERNLEDHG